MRLEAEDPELSARCQADPDHGLGRLIRYQVFLPIAHPSTVCSYMALHALVLILAFWYPPGIPSDRIHASIMFYMALHAWWVLF